MSLRGKGPDLRAACANAEGVMAANDDVEIPHHAIREAQDRSWTGDLLARFASPDLGDDEAQDVAFTLEALADPRAEAPLARVLADRSRAASLRDAAGAILRTTGAVDRASIRVMMRDGDAIEQRHAVRAMDHGEVDLVEPIALDPDHPLHGDAIATMEWGFEEPRLVAAKIAALSHRDARVREIAAEALAWDEPIDAEEALIRAASDPIDAVAVAALGTLRYYKTRRTLAALATMRTRGGEPGERAEESFDELRGSFQKEIRDAEPKAREGLIAWMRPVWDILAFDEDELRPEPIRQSDPPILDDRFHVAVSPASLRADLTDLDGPWGAKIRALRDADPTLFSHAERPRLATLFVEHPDPAVRAECGHLLAAWGDHASLIRLTGDARFIVMKHAMYELGRTPPNAAAAVCALDHLDGPRVTSTHAYETLATYVAHARPAAAILLLARRVLDDEREAVRHHGVHALAKLGAKAEIEALLPLLSEPPRLTWGVHVALLEVSRGFGLTPRDRDLERLRDADDLDVQRVLLG